MIISKTPLRISFVGGGSDLPSFYREHGGAVLSTAIDKYIYVTVNEKFDDHIRLSYSKTEEVSSVDKIEHKLVRECLRLLKITGGIEITSIADIPSRGTGLGSSSAFCAGLLHALHVYNRRYVSAKALAEQTCQLEIDICKEPIGKQDQYASAYGGVNLIRFNQDDSVFVEPVICLRDTLERMQKNCIVFFTGITRSASGLLKQQDAQVRESREKQAVLKKMVQLAHQLKTELQENRLDSFGEILHENWVLKKSLTEGVSTSEIDEWYDKALNAGAIGGKLLGAGSGGFLLFYAPQEKHASIAKALHPLRQVQMGFEPQGSQIIFVH